MHGMSAVPVCNSMKIQVGQVRLQNFFGWNKQVEENIGYHEKDLSIKKKKTKSASL